MNIQSEENEETIRKRLANIEKKNELELDELQRDAVVEAVKNGLLIITGGPGTGKTTTINAIIQYFEMEGMDIFLAAPTGRAAKRMTETTGYQASTIHRLLELSGMMDDSSAAVHFEFSLHFLHTGRFPSPVSCCQPNESKKTEIYPVSPYSSANDR